MEGVAGRDTAAEEVLIPGVVSHATNVVEHPELVADRIVQYAQLVGRENVIAGTDCGLGGRIHPSLAWAKLQVLVEGRYTRVAPALAVALVSAFRRSGPALAWTLPTTVEHGDDGRLLSC